MLTPNNSGFTYGQARRALIDAGFIPLCHIEQAEHFVRDNRRVILYVDDLKQPVEHIGLERVSYVTFVRVGDMLIPLT